MNTGAIEVATFARNLVKAGWSQDANARDKNGKPCEYTTPEACSYCAGAAIQRARRDLSESEGAMLAVFLALCDHIGHSLTWSEIVIWNDDSDRTKEQVLAAFDAVIANLVLEDADGRL